MEKESLSLLRYIIDRGSISLYDLAEAQRREKTFDDVVQMTYFLAGQNLVELEIIEGEDGTEAIVKPTPLGKTYVKAEKAMKGARRSLKDV